MAEQHWNYNELTQPERAAVRAQYIERQGGKCSHCGEPIDGMPSVLVRQKRVNSKLFPRGFFRWPVHLHHDHKTGRTLGAVHSYCNAVLWQYHGQ